ncbi:MAG: hypothetical protein ABRQ24_03215 [Syntrophomonadaceae bacterium]
MIEIKKALIIISIPILALLIFAYIKSGIALVDDIPSVFDKSKFTVKIENGGTWLYQGNKLTFPIAHDEKRTLYILNGTGQDFIRFGIFNTYKIDRAKKEIVIVYDLVNYTPQEKAQFQVIEVPHYRYSALVINNKIRVRIKCGSAFDLIEYDFQTKTYTNIDSNPYAK